MKTPAIRPIPALIALTLIAALAALILYAAFPANAANHWTDYDTDDDGLIDIRTIAQLQGLRFDHNGDGFINTSLIVVPASDRTDYDAAFPNRQTVSAPTSTDPRMGCPGVCAGYELMNDLDFATATTSLRDWIPSNYNYTATLEGNGYTISNMNITQNAISGLFPTLNPTGIVRNLGLINPTVAAQASVGPLAGNNQGTIVASWVSGGAVTINGVAQTSIGGLVGNNSGDGVIIASYSTASVDAGSTQVNVNVGGLVGRNQSVITASYAAGTTTGSVTGPGSAIAIGGLVGHAAHASSSITDSYCSASTGRANCIGNPGSSAGRYTAAELQAPTGYTGIYANWNVDLSTTTTYPAAFPDNPWNFGSTTTYPKLKTPAQRQADPVVDYDLNDNNLIDIDSLYQLNAIRHDLNGDGLPDAAANYPAYAGAFVNGDLATTTPAAARMGCPQTCAGYELTRNLNFDMDGDGQVGVTTTSTDPYPNFAPIGGSYTATFDGNGRTISHLTFNAAGSAGLFHTLGNGGVIRNVGMITPQVSNTGNAVYLGSLAGVIAAGGEVSASYAQGGTVNVGAANSFGGGLLGLNSGAVRASYATEVTISATSSSASGGLAGAANGAFTASYAASAVSSGLNRGGFVAFLSGGSITDSYCDSASGATACAGTGSATGNATPQTRAQLQTPTAYTGIYANWNIDIDADTFPDNPWNFGSTTTYPTLKTPAQRQAAAGTGDYDADGDNLIDIDSLDQLNAIRHDLNGDGRPDAVGSYAAYAGAFPDGNIADTSTPYMGCAATCAGYELTESLNFDLDGDGRVGGVATSTDPYPNWTPIGPSPGYSATFDGNGRTITRLTITGNVRAGLFDTLAAGGVIRDVGIIAPSVRAAPPIGQYIGVLTASNGGTITASYVQGGSVTVTNAYTYAGGLTGGNSGTIRASYATASVTKTDVNSNVGGLAGFSSGEIIASYAAGPVAGPGPATRVGAFVGTLSSPAAAITDSNCDTSVHTTPRPCVAVHISGANSGVTAAGYTAAQLQAPTGYTDMYRNWNLDLDGDTFPDYPWNFGTTSTYPTLYTPTQRQTAAARVVDYDLDDDNLIDITNLHQLNALRYDPDGNGLPDDAAHYSAYTGGYPNGNIADTSTPYIGCESACIGYELMVADLDFDTDGDNDVDSDDAYPNWTPIASYQSTLEGNGYTISHPTVAAGGNAGLFAALGASAVIRDLGIIDADITSSGASAKAGVLAAANAGQISASYAQSGRVTITGATPVAGGLIGENTGEILAVWSTAAVNASTTGAGFGGGLIGRHSGSLSASYAAGPVTGSATSTAGGLIGQIDTAGVTIVKSYCDTTATTQSNCIGHRATSAPAAVVAEAVAYPTAELKTPTGYTGIYESWNIDLDGDGNNDYPWNFGEAADYPMLYTPTERQARIEAGEDTLPPPLPRTIPPEPEKEYNPAADHPEIYANAEYEMAATCQTHDVDPETGNPRAATVTFDLGSYTGPVLLHLSIWRNGRYMAYETQGIALPTLERNGQRATLRVDTDPAQTRFRLDGRRNGLAANLVLGYANCHGTQRPLTPKPQKIPSPTGGGLGWGRPPCAPPPRFPTHPLRPPQRQGYNHPAMKTAQHYAMPLAGPLAPGGVFPASPSSPKMAALPCLRRMAPPPPKPPRPAERLRRWQPPGP